ncbi:hypothetical protein [Euzebya sp.]|uniref:hypothetical protein n=1 Tax=Euzebya sp. TaxID=1971409 RepID=UPI00351180FC
MYRDDVCAVCGESLPPDHLYCREHAAVVDELLHDIGERLPRLADDLRAVADLVAKIHPETWDYLSEDHPDEPLWPPRPELVTTTDGADLDVDVDSEPGRVTVSVRNDLAALLGDLAAALARTTVADMAAAARDVEGAGATH